MPISPMNPLMVAMIVVALAACSDTGSSSSPAPAADSPASTATPVAPTSAGAKAAPAPKGDCDLISHEELSQAFGGKLTVRRSGGHGGRGGACTYDIVEVNESQLVVQAGDAAAYASRKEAYSGYSGVPMDPVAIGKEAFLVNNAQLIVLDEDGQSLSLGLQLITVGQTPPVGHDEVAVALQSLARTALDRM